MKVRTTISIVFSKIIFNQVLWHLNNAPHLKFYLNQNLSHYQMIQKVNHLVNNRSEKIYLVIRFGWNTCSLFTWYEIIMWQKTQYQIIPIRKPTSRTYNSSWITEYVRNLVASFWDYHFYCFSRLVCKTGLI